MLDCGGQPLDLIWPLLVDALDYAAHLLSDLAVDPIHRLSHEFIDASIDYFLGGLYDIGHAFRGVCPEPIL